MEQTTVPDVALEMQSQVLELAQAQPILRVPCEVYSRIVGYLRPVQNWNQGKQQEFHERKPFQVPDPILNPEE